MAHKEEEFEPLKTVKDVHAEEKGEILQFTEEEDDDNGQCFLRNVTVEPVVFLLMFSYITGVMTTQNVALQKACLVNLNYSEEICNSLSKKDSPEAKIYEQDVQKLMTVVMSYQTYFTATIPSVMSILIGSWSDRTGQRKMFLLLPTVGQLLVAISCIINVYFFRELDLYWLVLSQAIIEGFTGGWCVLFVTCFSYIGVITDMKNRTHRLGIVNFCTTVSFPVGMGLSGLILKYYGYYGGYGVMAVVISINILYILIFVQDPPKTKAQKELPRGGRFFFKNFFDLTNFLHTLKVVFRKRPQQKRQRLCFLLVTVTILFGPFFGEMSVLYLSTRVRFDWNELQFSMFQTYNFVLHTFGTIFAIMVFSKWLKWQDATLGILSTTSKIISCFVYCFAWNQNIFLAAPLVDVFNTALLAMRSLVSKIVEPDELGKLNSIVGLAENIMPLLYVPLYARVYAATMSVLPGSFFLMSAALTVPALAVFAWLLHNGNKNDRINANAARENNLE